MSRAKEYRKSVDALIGKNRELAASGRAAFLQGKTIRGVHDEHLLHREIYNPNKFPIEFRRNKDMDQYVSSSFIPLGPELAICKPDDFLYLPHIYYLVSGVGIPDGTPIDVIQNFGDSMFKGNKLPSRPG